MSIQLSQKPFGPYTLYTLGNTDTHISFVPGRCAYIHQIRLKCHDLLWNYASGEELTGNSWYRNLALFPFPNRLRNGKYDWEGKTFAFDINNPETQSALHGFAPDVEFNLERVDLSAHEATVKLTHLHRVEEHPKSYSFLMKFDLLLVVDVKAHTVSWSLSATNLGASSAPVGLGWHPYFLLPGGYDQWKVKMPPNAHVVLKNALPTGMRAVGLSSKQPVTIDTDWDDCFALTNLNTREVQLIGSAYSLSLKQTGSTRYTQLFVPPVEEDCLAIEPMSCGVDAFNVDRGEVELAPKQRVVIGMEVSLAI